MNGVNICQNDRTQLSVKMCSVTVSARLGKGYLGGCLGESRALLGISRPRAQRIARHGVVAAIGETDRLTPAEEQLKAEAPRPVGDFIDENVRSTYDPTKFERLSLSGHFRRELVSHSSDKVNRLHSGFAGEIHTRFLG